jgi:hypothetical protein
MVAAMRTDGADDEINPSSTDGSNDENRNQDQSERCVFSGVHFISLRNLLWVINYRTLMAAKFSEINLPSLPMKTLPSLENFILWQD